MNDEETKTANKQSAGKVVAAGLGLILGWLSAVCVAFFLGMPVALAGGMKSGGWNLQLIAPMLLAGAVAAVIYLPIYAGVRAYSKDYGVALVCAIIFAVILGMIAAYLMGMNA